MVHQFTLWDRVEDWSRDRAGMLRRRIPAATVFRLFATGAAALLVFETAIRLLR